jgi:F-type H+-transporting ATPase subunit delta
MTDTQAGPGGEHVPLHPTVFDEKASVLARTYAEALLNAAAKASDAGEVLDELDALRDVLLVRFPLFAEMMRSPVRSKDDRDAMLVKTFGGRTSPVALNFLRVLNRRGRLGLLGQVLAAARESWERRQNRRPVSVRSAAPLADDQREAIRDRLARALNATPVITAEVDPALIGGLVVQVGDVVYDGSVRNRLEQLRNRLIRG